MRLTKAVAMGSREAELRTWTTMVWLRSGAGASANQEPRQTSRKPIRLTAVSVEAQKDS
jgi:hypothetical protein